MRLLLYGFGPYKQFRENITAKIIKAVPKRPGLRKLVFPVRFSRRQFIDAVERFRPDFVIGTGQCSRGRLIRIERQAINRKRNHKREKCRPIIGRGPKALRTTLKIESLSVAGAARISRDAGDYVCNFSIYVLLDHLARHRPAARFGFLHIPHRYNAKSAVRFVVRTWKELKILSVRTPEQLALARIIHGPRKSHHTV